MAGETASDPPAASRRTCWPEQSAYRLQEKALGGLAADHRLLRSLVKPGGEPPRQVKVGSVIVREHQGVVHEVLVVPGGFCWQGKTYDSLSTIAKTITGTSWNGPRFFGLRSRRCRIRKSRPPGRPRDRDGKPRFVASEGCRRSGRRSSVRPASGDGEGAVKAHVKIVAPKRQRCAIYTRKSTEHNLDWPSPHSTLRGKPARPISRARRMRAGPWFGTASTTAVCRALPWTALPCRTCSTRCAPARSTLSWCTRSIV